MKPFPPARVRCPRCSHPLAACRYEEAELDVCPKCGGLWCDSGDWSHRHGARPDQPPAEDESGLIRSSLHCPVDREALFAVGVEGLREFEIDVCRACQGVWFDQREWDHLASLRNWQGHHERLAVPTWSQWFFELLLRLPVEYNVRPRRVPLVVLTLIAICFAVQVVGQFVSIDSLVLVGNALPYTHALISHMFVHADWLHFVGNLYFLYILGDNVEDVLGHAGFLFFYLACGIAASLAHVGLTGEFERGLVGASGAISGVIAAYLILFHRARLTFMVILWQLRVPAWAWLSAWFGLQILGAALDLSGRASDIAWIAHIAGFVTGAVLILPFRARLAHAHPLLELLETRRIGAPPAVLG